MEAITDISGTLVVTYYGERADTKTLLTAMEAAPVIEGRGRGSIKVIYIGGRRLVVRKYLHGGLFRAFTGDRFVSARRCRDEAEIMLYLAGKGFPVAQVFCTISEGAGLWKGLSLVTVMEEDAISLLDQLGRSSQKARLRTVRDFARLFRALEEAGVYHPDLHLNNVLVTPGGRLVFLDFDRARRKVITPGDVKAMLWRLNRYADKMARHGKIVIGQREKAFFLRIYGRLAGSRLETIMAAEATKKSLIYRLGWFVESIFYGGRRSGPERG